MVHMIYFLFRMIKYTIVTIVAVCLSVLPVIAESEMPFAGEFEPFVNVTVNYKSWIILSQWRVKSSGHAGFVAGHCTDYAASRRLDLFLSNGKRLITGNAKERLSNAKELGFETGTEPKEWAIAVYFRNAGVSSYGHVAYVESVGDNGVIVVSDMNYRWKFVVTQRTVQSNLAAWYIY